MTQMISVVYVKEPSDEPSMTEILAALVDSLGIEIIHAEPHGNSVRIKLHDDVKIDVIRHVLNTAFPHKLSIFATSVKRVYITYLHGASIQPSAIAIMAALADAGYESIEIIDTVPGEAVTLSVPINILTVDIAGILSREFNHGLAVSLDEKTQEKTDTLDEAYHILREAALLMKAKNADYGDSWRLMRLSSITDQILVKIQRVRTIEESVDAPKVSEGVESEYIDILNYCVFAILKLREDKVGIA